VVSDYKETNSINLTAKKFKLSWYLVKKFVNNPDHSTHNPPPPCHELSSSIRQIISSNSSLYLKEIREEVFRRELELVSNSTICRILDTLSLSRKRVDEHAVEKFSDYAIERRRMYHAQISQFLVEQMIFLDETGLDYNTIKRRFARSSVGVKATSVRKYTKTKRINVISAIGWDGLVGFRIIDQPTGAVDFNSFIFDILPLLRPGSVLVFDNASFHRAESLEAIVNLSGHFMLFLPPYSPDLNPIEISYSWLKKSLRAELDRSPNLFDLIASTASTYGRINATLTRAWFHNCSYAHIDPLTLEWS